LNNKIEKEKNQSQTRLIFKTRVTSHKIELPHRRQTRKNHEAKFSIIQNFKKKTKLKEIKRIKKNLVQKLNEIKQ
jgi:hypothetical protein